MTIERGARQLRAVVGQSRAVLADGRARALKISRNRLIVRALERELKEASEWSSGFLEQLAERDPDVEEAADEMSSAIRKGRRSKKPVEL